MGNTALRTGVITLGWETDPQGVVTYMLTAIESDGQLRHISSYEQGPFDTALEVARWAWRTITREVPPARC